MYRIFLILGVSLNCLIAASEDQSKHNSPETSRSSHALTSTVTRNNVASHHNISYVDKTENMLRTPNIKKHYPDNKTKKKLKKSPKSTIQKIIKKNRTKMRKLYINQIKSKTTLLPNVDYDKIYGQKEKSWKEGTTTHANQKKKSRKYSPKMAGFHLPFQRMKEKRIKRGLSRELYILKDLDEIEFLSKEDGDDVVKAHVKNIW